MKRAWRWMLNGVTVLSLMLCVGTVVAWAASYGYVAQVSYYSKGERGFNFEITSADGVISTERLLGSFDAGQEPTDNPTPIRIEISRERTHAIYDAGWIPRGGLWGSFHFEPARQFFFAFPHWSLVVVTAIVPLCAGAMPIARMFRRKRFGHGQCAKCSYDLTANVSGVCPECGTKVATKT